MSAPAPQAVSQAESLIGKTLAGTYVVSRLLGRGAMGAVYAARHERTGRQVALKALYRDVAMDPKLVRRFEHEARIASGLRHPHIVHFIDFHVEADGTPFLVMELLEGEDLQARLDALGRLPLETVLRLARQVGGALLAAHERGIVHRDVKPSNVFLCRPQAPVGAAETAKVVDFGVSKVRSAAASAKLTQELTLLGTPEYMSPEAALGAHDDLDGRADQYALAVILYRCLAGRMPYGEFNDDQSMMSVLYHVIHEPAQPLDVAGVPAHVAAALARALAKKKEERFPTMADFVAALEGAGWSAAPDDATRSAPLPPAAPPSQRAPAPALAEPGVLSAGPDDRTSAALPLRPISEAQTAVATYLPPVLSPGAAPLPPGPASGPLSRLPHVAVVPPPAPLHRRRLGMLFAAAMAAAVLATVLIGAHAHRPPVPPPVPVPVITGDAPPAVPPSPAPQVPPQPPHPVVPGEPPPAVATDAPAGKDHVVRPDPHRKKRRLSLIPGSI